MGLPTMLTLFAAVFAVTGMASVLVNPDKPEGRFYFGYPVKFDNRYTASRTIARVSDSLPADSVPAPWLDNHNICAPSSSGPSQGATANICDPSGLLTSRHLDLLNHKIYPIFRGEAPYSLVECPPTSNRASQGFRIAILTIRNLPADGNTLATRARLYAEAVFTNWNLRDNCGASVFILLSWEDRRLYIKTGSLAARYISSSKINDVFQSMTDHLKNGDIYSALDSAVSELSARLRSYHSSHPNPQPPSKPTPGAAPGSTDDGPFGPLFFSRGPSWWDLELSLVVVVCAICLVSACCHGFGGPDVARLRRDKKALLRKLEVVRTEYIRASMTQYEPSSCPVCQEKVSEDKENDETEEDEGDPLTGQKVHDSSAESEKSPRSTKRYPCGHVFHEKCLQSLPSRPTGCPVCDAGKPGEDVPSLSDSRGKDYMYRLDRLRNEYSHLLTAPLLGQLCDSNPTTWPSTLDESFLSRGTGVRSHGYSEIGSSPDTYWQGGQNRGWGGGGGSGAGGMLAAGAAGVGAGWLLNNAFSGGGDGQQQQQQQQQLQQDQGQGFGWNAEGGTGASWGNAQMGSGNPSWLGQQSVDDGAGQGTGWGDAGNSMSQAFSSLTGGWGGGSSQADGGDDGGGGDGAGW